MSHPNERPPIPAPEPETPQEAAVSETDAAIETESALLPKGPRLRYILRSLELLHSTPEYGPDGNRIPPDPEKHWTRLHENVKPWNGGLELSDNVREAVWNFIQERLPRMKELAPSIGHLPDRTLLDALANNWFEGAEEETGDRTKVLLTVMAHVVKRLETHAYKELLERASPAELEKLGLDAATRRLTTDLMQASIDADPLFIRFLAYSQKSGEAPEDASHTALFVPGDENPRTVGELFPRETKRLSRNLSGIAATYENWSDKTGAEAFREYLETLAASYAETDAEKARSVQSRVVELYGQVVESGFPILLTPALGSYTKEPYLDPELRVCLATPDARREEDAFRSMRDAMAEDLPRLGLGAHADTLRGKDVRNVVAVGSYGVNLAFNAVAQEDPAILLYLNEQIRAYDRNFPEMMARVKETPERFSDVADETDRRELMERMSRANTVMHEFSHQVFVEGSPEAKRFGDGKAWTAVNEVRAEILYRAFVPSLVERGRVDGTKEQWAHSTLATALQMLRDEPPGNPYNYAAAYALNDLFDQGAVRFENGKISLPDTEAYWRILDAAAREVIDLFRNETMTEATATSWLKKRCAPSPKVSELKTFLEAQAAAA